MYLIGIYYYFYEKKKEEFIFYRLEYKHMDGFQYSYTNTLSSYWASTQSNQVT